MASATRPARTSFRTMGVTAELFVAAEGDAVREAAALAEREFARLERIFSRFDPGSELSLLNRRGRLAASPDLVAVTEIAVAARERSGGLVDATVHDALVAWGYDRTFAELASHAPPPPRERPRCGGAISIDTATGVIELEAGTRLDFGGLAKGYAVERACDLLERAGSCLVNAGGDLAVRLTPDGDPWPIGIVLDGESLTVNLSSGALATSGRDVRRWQAGDVAAHHLIDPRTSSPSQSDLVRATAWAATAVEAEVVAKTLFLLGAAGARRLAEAEGIPAVLVPAAGGPVRTGAFA